MSSIHPDTLPGISASHSLLSSEELRKLDAYWRAANYLSVGQIYLYKNPLLREPLKLEHIKPRLLGHWGTSPGLSLIYVHLNRLITEHDVNMIYLAGPGHGLGRKPKCETRSPNLQEFRGAVAVPNSDFAFQPHYPLDC